MIHVYRDATAGIIRLDYDAPILSWDEYHAAVKQSYTLAIAETDAVYILHNAGDAMLPPGNPTLHVRQALLQAPTQVEALVVHIRNSFARRITEITTGTHQQSQPTVYFTESLDEAYELIATLREV